MITFKVHPTFEGKNIRTWLSFYHLSKTNIYKLETFKKLTVNGVFYLFDHLLKTNDKIKIDFSEIHLSDTLPCEGEVDIVYEDDDLMVLNKPEHLLVHTDGITNDTLTNRLKFHMDQKGYLYPVMPVHRIDFETSGIVLYAKHLLAQSYLSSLFEKNDIKKTYVCLCQYPFKDKQGVIHKRIGADRHSNKQIISATGKDAKTIYKVLSTDQYQSRVEVEIIGGRKHQIRVHMASINHPIIGDKLYGKKTADRCMLHFKKAQFTHPRSLERFEMTCRENF